jgi:hypothetical protein
MEDGYQEGEGSFLVHDIWARAQAKWRGILAYSVLQAAMRFVTALIMAHEPLAIVRLYASLALLATTIFTLVHMYRLLTRDEPGDEAWPPIWS